MRKEQVEVLKTADEYLYNLKAGINKVVVYINEEKEGEACELMIDIASGIEWLIKVINLTRDIQSENIELGELEEFLKEIVEALENEDYILVGDLFNYEIIPMLESIHRNIKNLI